MVSIDSNAYSFSEPLDVAAMDSVGVGPGLGQSKETINAFSKLLNRSKPMVIDADALNIIGLYKELQLIITPGSILTPHPKEFERLVDSWANDFERLEKQKKLSIKLKSVIVLKGANTSITTPEGIVFFNSTGNPGMATAGAGDVLTGVLISLMAQGYSCVDSAIIGVYLHGLAGDLAAREIGMDSLIASDLVDFLSKAFLKVRS
jgi:NAD(P)H-hydrate epimerase